MRPTIAVMLFALVLPQQAGSAERVTGVASVIDGDTIEIHGRRIRLSGKDAPESSQTCTANGAIYRCGQKAALALADRIGRRLVACDQQSTDRYGRMVAVCSEGQVDLSEWMVAQGHAIAYRKYSLAYVPAEEKAKAAHVGLWAGEFQNPAEFRHGPVPPSVPAEQQPGRCRMPDDLDVGGYRCGARSAASRGNW